MVMQKFLSGIAVVLVVSFVVISCSDMGDEPVSAFTASVLSVQVNPGQQVTVEISGGVLPYAITESPDPSLATANFVNPNVSPASLVIAVPSTVTIGGTTHVTIGNSHSEEDIVAGALYHDDEITIAITVSLTPPLTATPPQVTVGQSQGANVVIGNGTPPYVIAQAPNAAYASAAFIDANANPATLVITGVSVASVSGSTFVKVRDSSPSPQREVSVNITKIP